MKSKLSNLISNILSDFFDLITKKYKIDVRTDWNDFQNVHFCIYKYSRNPRKGEVCAIKIKNGELNKVDDYKYLGS